MGLLDGKVAIITGAGGGLGEAYARLFAREGAAVVVNDLGGARDGSGDGSVSAAQMVVNAILAEGGRAVANADEPVVQVDRRIAVTGNQADLVADRQFDLRPLQPQHAVLVGRTDVAGAFDVRHGRIARIG